MKAAVFFALLAAAAAHAQQRADIVITNGKIKNIRPTLTMVGGRVVFRTGK